MTGRLVRTAIPMALAVAAFGCGSKGPSELDALLPIPTFGSFATTNAQYRFPPATDTEVVPDQPIEIWGEIYRPVDAQGPRPIVVIMPGQHATCRRQGRRGADYGSEYDATGECPPGDDVIENQAGYAYIAERLASYGYIVDALNANRGVMSQPGPPDDPYRVTERSRLILRHLGLLSQWNRGVAGTPGSLGFDLQNAINFSNIGLIGHSRGSEAVRGTPAEYARSGAPWQTDIAVPIDFRAIFEIAPSYRNPAIQIPKGIAWASLIAMCDGQVSQGTGGVIPFNNAKNDTSALRTIWSVYGANHNFFNTEWQTNDARLGCPGVDEGNIPIFVPSRTESPQQQAVATVGILALMRTYMGDHDTELSGVLDPAIPLPDFMGKITRIDRNEMPIFNGQVIFEHEVPANLARPAAEKPAQITVKINPVIPVNGFRFFSVLTKYSAAPTESAWVTEPCKPIFSLSLLLDDGTSLAITAPTWRDLGSGKCKALFPIESAALPNERHVVSAVFNLDDAPIGTAASVQAIQLYKSLPD